MLDLKIYMKKSIKESKITLDRFAIMVMKEFKSVHEGISDFKNTTNEKFKIMEGRFDRVESTLSLIISDVDIIKDKIKSIEEYIQSSNNRIVSNNEDIDSLYRELNFMKKRIQEIEHTIKSRVK